MRREQPKHKNLALTDCLLNRMALFSGLYCVTVGTLTALFPHPRWMSTSVYIVLFLSAAATSLALKFRSEE